MRAIYKREFQSYFRSMTGNVFVALLVVFTGIYFMAYNLNMGYPYFSYSLAGSLMVYLVAIPILTMRSFSEERKNKTDQLLLTAPVSLFKVILGKYLAMISVLAIPMVIFCLFPLIIKMQGTAYLGIDYLSILVFYLLGCVYVAIGMFISSLTESQIIASISTFGILLVLYLWNGILGFLPSSAIGWTDRNSAAIYSGSGLYLPHDGKCHFKRRTGVIGDCGRCCHISGKIQPVREPFNQLSVRSGVDGCIFRNRGQQYSGCERNRAVSVS